MADRSVLVRLRANVSSFNRDIGTSSAAVGTLESRLRSADREGGAAIDRLSGRIGLLVDGLLTVGPAAIPIGAVAAPAVTLLASSLGFMALTAGSAVIAFQGVGDALDKVNKAQLEPTEANIEAAEKAMKRLSPVARDMVKQLDALGGLGEQLRDAGAEELFPDLIEALDTIVERGPEVERIVRALNSELGEIAKDTAESLNSKRWDDFFRMLKTQGPPVLDATADALGNIVHGLSEIMEAFIPLNRDGLDWLVEMTEGFDEWATGLKKTEGFKEFSEYVREHGPRLAETLGAVATAGVDIVTAAAPLGGPALQAIESFAEMVSLVADSDFATPLLAGVAAMRTINRLAPATAGSLTLLAGGRAAGAAVAGAATAGGKDDGSKDRGRSKPRRGRGISPGTGLSTLIGADILAAELGWEEASERQVERAEEFSKKWGKSWDEAAEEARVKLSKVLDVATGTGLFGLRANDRGLTDRLLTLPVERQIKLQKKLREEYGLGYKALENQGILQEGFVEQFKRQRQQVSPLAEDIRRLGEIKAKPEIDLDDKGARAKQREAEDWLTDFGQTKRSATLDLLDTSRRKKSDQADDWISAWGEKRTAATADVDAQQAFVQFRLLNLRMAELDGKTATTYLRTVRTGEEATGFGPQPAADTAGHRAPRERLHDGRADRIPQLTVPTAPRSSLSLSDRDIDRLAGAMAQMRPNGQLYGDVYVTDGYGGFKRQLQEDQQLAGLGGFS